MIIFLGLAVVVAWAYLTFAYGSFWIPLFPESAPLRAQMPSVDIIVPARNEAKILPLSLPSLLTQEYSGSWRIILIDDHSDDGTADIAREIALKAGKQDRLTVISAPDLPEGWSGKVAAMNTGVLYSISEMILFTDADIRHHPKSLERLVARALDKNLDLVSRMVRLHCSSFAEKLLIPAFVFFFAMLYPFRRVNNPRSEVAAAAGGTMLVRRASLDKIGGLAAIKSALIDDCSLAKALKDHRQMIELTLTNDIRSLRAYPEIKDIWTMIARTAYTQLRYSPLMLAGTILGLCFMYLLPLVLFLFAPTMLPAVFGLVAYVLMTAIYIPTVTAYNQPWYWALTLPAAAMVYAAATVASARLYHKGKGGLWKGRTQA